MHLGNLMTAIVLPCLLVGNAVAEHWTVTVENRLLEYGHRNWIVVADSAYPKQSAAGIETVWTRAGQVEVLDYVLKAIDRTKHVRPVVMLDAELTSVPNDQAPGVDQYREDLKKILQERAVSRMPHEEIISKLDESSKLFNILILKTDLTIPYTSVFIELDCGYWSAEQEALLRKTLDAAKD